MRNINDLIRIINGISYDDNNNIDRKIEFLRNCVKDRKNIRIHINRQSMHMVKLWR